MDDTLLSMLQQKAIHDQISVIWTDGLGIYTPPSVSVARRKVVMNLKWFNQKELTFQLAHEMAHIYNQDAEDRLYYYSNRYTKSTIENAAHSRALDMLIPTYIGDCEPSEVNVVNFIQSYAIPAYLETKVFTKFRNYFS